MPEELEVLVVVLLNPRAPPTEDIDGAGVDVVFKNRGLPVLEGLKEVIVPLEDSIGPPPEAVDAAVG